MIYITVNTISEFVCLLAGLIFLSKDKDPAWRLMLAYLLLTCIVEVAGIYIRKVLHVSNIPLYTVSLLPECFVTSYFFYSLYKVYHPKIKWLIIWLSVFLIMYFTELILNHFSDFVSITASVMSVVFVLASLYYYYLKLKDEHFERLLFYAPFWWVSGTLFFYFGSTACNLFFDYLIKYPSISYEFSIRYIIFCILDVILYYFWSYAFICRYLQRKSYS